MIQTGLDAFVEALELAENDAVRSRMEKASICAYRTTARILSYPK